MYHLKVIEISPNKRRTVITNRFIELIRYGLSNTGDSDDLE